MYAEIPKQGVFNDLRYGRQGPRKTHGLTNSSEYRIWGKMKTRCFDKNTPIFHRYGGRGITVCDRWANSFENFLSDMGLRPTAKHSIDRIDNDGNYEPGNCRWATAKEQANNRSSSILIAINGATKPLSVWADEYGLSRAVIAARISNGDSGESLIRPLGLRTRQITFRGITDTQIGWSNRTGISHKTISQRLKRDKWSVEKTLTYGVST